MAAILPIEILISVLNGLEESKGCLELLQVCQHWNTALFAQVGSAPEELPTKVSYTSSVTQTATVNFFDEPKFYNRTLFHEFLESFKDDNDEELTSCEEKLDKRDFYS
ncbi:hypothetical protein N7448_008061 [Penicillium atrosanguineum]|uniref:uncharacterized protein n=1 Tax=Penicillium atrosanguineum TaxID=1132637 RepID=UPI0023921DA5|nr:uncharacterized protein N7443_000920 [Penicillium atrosanguineum]KAJ5127282.1 hypothetical protein N7448_008061 [Penicillium atrosanguineum]KAJ5314036.1 hypothetical protein N7443_000920 [Penicillium atrosanguineum]